MNLLIVKLEAATEGSRELDARLWAERDNRDVRRGDDGSLLARSKTEPHDECLILYPNGRPDTTIPTYTTSLDAALTLVPENREYRICKHRGGERSTMPGIWYEAVTFDYELDLVTGGKTRSTPALALCIAALKAEKAQNVLLDTAPRSMS